MAFSEVAGRRDEPRRNGLTSPVLAERLSLDAPCTTVISFTILLSLTDTVRPPPPRRERWFSSTLSILWYLIGPVEKQPVVSGRDCPLFSSIMLALDDWLVETSVWSQSLFSCLSCPGSRKGVISLGPASNAGSRCWCELSRHIAVSVSLCWAGGAGEVKIVIELELRSRCGLSCNWAEVCLDSTRCCWDFFLQTFLRLFLFLRRKKRLTHCTMRLPRPMTLHPAGKNNLILNLLQVTLETYKKRRLSFLAGVLFHWSKLSVFTHSDLGNALNLKMHQRMRARVAYPVYPVSQNFGDPPNLGTPIPILWGSS